LDDQRKDGETNFIFSIKEKETRLTLHEHDYDNDEHTLHFLSENQAQRIVTDCR